MSIPVPKWAEAPLTPAPLANATPSPAACKLLQNVCKQTISKGETFSVTNSPMTCPADKNYLFTVKPYFWDTEPGSGCWGAYWWIVVDRWLGSVGFPG